jgi:hypothetical protein
MGRSLWFADPLMREKYGMPRLPGFQAGLKILGFDVYFMDILWSLMGFN